MSIELVPATVLQFHGPFSQVVRESMHITNSSSNPIAFKVKTTAPKQYCVRPNSGRVEPQETVEIHVLLQPLKEDPPADYKCKDKFLIQSVEITPERESFSYTELWSTLEKTQKSAISEKKIRCAFVSAATNNDAAAGSSSVISTPSRAISDLSQYGSVNGSSTAPKNIPIIESSTLSPPQGINNNTPSSTVREQVQEQPKVQEPNHVDVAEAVSDAGATVAVASSLRTQSEQVDNQEIVQLSATIEKLKHDLTMTQSKKNELEQDLKEKTDLLAVEKKATALLRQKVTDLSQANSNSKSKMAVAHPSSLDGVPIQIVMAIALVAFLIAYIFF